MKTLLIVGCGDVLTRALPWLSKRFRVLAVIRDRMRAPLIRAAGAIPVFADLDDARTLKRLSGLAHWVIHSAPPADQGDTDPRTARLVAALRRPRPGARPPPGVGKGAQGVAPRACVTSAPAGCMEIVRVNG